MTSQFNTLTIPELKNLARQRGLGGVSRFRKDELVQLLHSTQPKESDLSKIATDMQIELMSKMDLAELRKLCTSNKQSQQLCSNERLWQQLVSRRFGDIPLINNSWRETFIYYYNLFQPYLKFFGSLQAFLNIMLPSLLEYMEIVPEEANKYRLNLPANLVQDYAETHDPELLEEIKDHYQQLIRANPMNAPNPNHLYTLDFDRLLENLVNSTYPAKEIEWRTQDTINPKDPVNPYESIKLDPDQLKQLNSLLEKLKDPDFLQQFINVALPDLHYTSVINPDGVNNDPRSLLFKYYNGTPGLNILETGESFEHKINKSNISLLDLLKASMSVKSAKEDFNYERLDRIEDFNQQDQILTLSFDHGS